MEITAKYGVNFDFVPFFSIEPLSSREFRGQRVNILDYTAIVFSARSTIDAFFHLCNELRVKIPETMKYFCTSEAVAMYLQKHIVYRKRKIFFGDGTPASLISLIGTKHKGEKFLIATSDSTNNDITGVFEQNGLDFNSAIFVKSVSRDLKDVTPSKYDMIVLYNPSDVKSLFENFPDFKQDDIRFVSYGKSVVKAMSQESQNDYSDAEALYNLLEEQIVPLYYFRNQDAIPTRWVKTMKESMRTLIPAYSSHRMVRDYLRDYYMPTAERQNQMLSQDYEAVKRIVEWKQDIAARFGSVHVGLLRIDGMDSDTCMAGQPIRVTVSLDPGKMKQDELLVQFVVGPYNGSELTEKPDVTRMEYERTTSDHSLVFSCDYVTKHSGHQAYGVRILPTAANLCSDFDTNLVLWA